MPAWLYILRLKSGGLYIGATKDLEQRCKDHQAGKASRTTKIDPPAELIYSEEYETFVEARHREAQIKKWSKEIKSLDLGVQHEYMLIISNCGRSRLRSK